MMETIVVICIGFALAAACGFRVFVPMLVMSIAGKADYLQLASGFEWVESTPALATFAIATVVEIAAYYIPWIDNLLDTISVPAAVVAGFFVSAACIQDVSPLVKWSTAAIAGGGSAGTIKLGLSGLRLGSSMFTGGTANPIVATGEWIGSMLMSICAIVLPIFAASIVIVLLVFLVRFAAKMLLRIWNRKSKADFVPPKVG